MHSIKPGRGPSWGGVFGGIIGAVFGVFWLGAAASMGAPGFFQAFGVVFIVASLVRAGVCYHNATSSNRFSVYDITADGEETDPLDSRTRRSPQQPGTKPDSFCPKCGTGLKASFAFCPKCGNSVAPPSSR